MTDPAADALGLFQPVVARWFRDRVGEPTETQALAWPRIAAGRHVLVTAPTGSGKTLTAFLWALDRLLAGVWGGGRTRVLYISPLKALNNDIERNLLAPLAGLREALEAAGEHPAQVRVRTRSGDTPASQRQRMIRHPPEILITTPESLNLLLTSKGGRSVLGDLETVILDEIHAVAGSKRGTHLITAVERLVPLAGEFQRIALSATIRPLERVARFLGGYVMEGEGEATRYRPRPVEVVRSRQRKAYDLKVVFPEGLVEPPGPSAVSEAPPDPSRPPDGAWSELSREFKRRIRANRSTLLFGNSRRVVEKITRFLNEDEPAELAYSHHGSLSREIRSVVEGRLKEGRLSAIAATNSLELGIDIGSLEEVILVRTPPTVASAVQRLGRAGHRVGEISRGRLYPLFGRDFLDAAVVARAVLEQQIEEVRPVAGALDVLAQVILSMVAAEPWQIEELYRAVRCSDPYRELSRRQFELVLEMLAGRYADSRIRELMPRISIDRLSGRVKARPGAARLVFLSGGTIPDRGYFHLRLADTMAKLGELDEEFVWERSLGDTFTLGAQSWRIQRITHNDVLVTPARRAAAMAPFWRAEARNRSFHLSEMIGRFLEEAEETLDKKNGARELAARLERNHCMEGTAAAQLVELLERQRAATGLLPHRRQLLVERFEDAAAPRESANGKQQLVLHTFWGGRVNRPLAIALAAAWQERHRGPLEIDSDNDAIILAVPPGVETDEVLELVRSDSVEELLRRRLEKTGFFGARFRENAGRALLLPRSDLRRRVPLWLNRERAKKLLQTVTAYEDFPVLVETWRTCLQDEFEIETLEGLLAELEAGEIRVAEAVTSSPSPFAAGLIWQRTNRLMYEDDVPEGEGASGLSRDLLKELVYSSALRPRLPADFLEDFQRKLHRTYPSYSPQTAEDLVEWVKERIVIPADEWNQLMAAIETDAAAAAGEAPPAELQRQVADRVAWVELPLRGAGAGEVTRVVSAIETVPRLRQALAIGDGDEPRLGALGGGAAEVREVNRHLAALEEARAPATSSAPADADPLATLAAEWLRFYGPLARERLATAFGLDEERLRELLETLTESETVVIDHFRGDGSEAPLELCDAENLERLLRILRSRARTTLQTRPLAELPLFFAEHQGLVAGGDGVSHLERALERLFAYPAPAALWESDLLPARLDPYYPSWLDSLMQESELMWLGCGREKLTFVFPGDLELLREAAMTARGGAREPSEREPGGAVAELFPDPRARYSLEELARHGGLDTAELTRRLWERVWAGELSNTTFVAVRRAALNRFQALPVAAGASAGRPRGSGRSRFRGWRASRPFAGDWFLTAGEDGAGGQLDALDREELNKERARLLLQRYGVLFRELLARELPAFGWSRLFRSLRLMELSGEVYSGHFFSGIQGLQFASAAAVRRLREGLSADAVYWMNAVDPASPCGLGLEELKGAVPARLPSSHLVFHGSRLVLLSRRSGGELEIRVAPDHPHLAEYLEPLRVLLTRQFQPLRSVDVEIINGEPATKSPYAGALAELFATTREVGSLRLRRRY